MRDRLVTVIPPCLAFALMAPLLGAATARGAGEESAALRIASVKVRTTKPGGAAWDAGGGAPTAAVSGRLNAARDRPSTEAGPWAAEMEAQMLKLRAYEPDDADALLALFCDTIRRVNARDYSRDQIRAWAPDDIDPAAWAGRFAGRFVVVAEETTRPIGFAELEPGGHIDRLYVSADHQRRGVGGALLEGLVTEARRRGVARLSVESSITARPFFEARGFALLAPQVVTLRWAEFVNHRMERVLV